MGSRRVVVIALGVLCVGSALRLFTTHGGALLATASCGLGAAVIQAVFPGIIKEQFPKRVAVVMGLYSSMLMGGGAFGALVSPKITGASGSWRAGLAWVALPAALAAVMTAWTLPPDEIPPSRSQPTAALLKRPRTWLLMACFGLVNGGYSSAVAWLAPFYQTKGWTNAARDSLLAMMTISQAIAALLLPVLASRNQDRRPWLWFTLSMQLIGFLGLGFWPNHTPTAWAILVGAGLGGCFALSMVIALDHLQDAKQAGALSALMQGGGFLIAAIPPWIVATLHELAGDFAAGWHFHFCCATVVAILALRLAPDGYGRAMKVPSNNQPGATVTEQERYHVA